MNTLSTAALTEIVTVAMLIAGMPFLLSVFHLEGIIRSALKPFMLIAEYPTTLIHEMSHALSSILLFNGRPAVSISPDGSGQANFRESGGLRNFLIVSAGYPAPFFIGAFLLTSVVYEAKTAILICVIGILALAVLTVRNFFGVLVVASFIGLLLFVFVHSTVNPFGVILFLAVTLIVRGTVDLADVRPSNQWSDGELRQTDMVYAMGGRGITFCFSFIAVLALVNIFLGMGTVFVIQQIMGR